LHHCLTGVHCTESLLPGATMLVAGNLCGQAGSSALMLPWEILRMGHCMPH